MRARRLSLSGAQGLAGLAIGLALFGQVSCKQRGVCDDVEGACLALTIVGEDTPMPLQALRTTLQLEGGMARDGLTQGEVTLPTTLRLVPPAGITAGTVRSIGVAGVRDGDDVSRGQTEPGFVWPDDVHIEATVRLTTLGSDADGGVQADGPVQTDMGTPPDLVVTPPGDMATPPPPTLKWTDESPSGMRQELHDVWATPTLTLAVGGNGIVLSRGMTGAWTGEASAATRDLFSVAINSTGTAWSTGEGPAAFRRDGAGWKSDSGGLVGGGTLWSVSPGASAGELWAGGDGGKVWRRNPMSGMWSAETAFSNGVQVTAVHYVDGVVFAVGKDGWATVRRDSWQPATPYNDLKGAGLYGVWGFSKSSAVAVGSKGLLVRFSSNAWQPGTQRVEPGQNELNGVWGSAAGRAWAVGYNGTIVRVDGATATALRTDNTQDLYSVFGRSESDVFAVGVHRSGTAVILHGAP
jgi:hypothetical protein